MQTSTLTATTDRPQLRRIVAAGLAVTALTAGIVFGTGDDTGGSSTPVTPAEATGSAEDLSAYDAELLRHHGVRVRVRREPSAAERFHHFR